MSLNGQLPQYRQYTFVVIEDGECEFVRINATSASEARQIVETANPGCIVDHAHDDLQMAA